MTGFSLKQAVDWCNTSGRFWPNPGKGPGRPPSPLDVVFEMCLKTRRTGTQKTAQPGRQERQGWSSLFPCLLLSESSMLLGWTTRLLVHSIPESPASPCRHQEPRGSPITAPYPILELSVRHKSVSDAHGDTLTTRRPKRGWESPRQDSRRPHSPRHQPRSRRGAKTLSCSPRNR